MLTGRLLSLFDELVCLFVDELCCKSIGGMQQNLLIAIVYMHAATPVLYRLYHQLNGDRMQGLICQFAFGFH